MSLRSQSINNIENADSLYAAGSESRPRCNVWIGLPGLSIDALQVEGMNKPGRPITIPDFTKAIDYEQIMAGAVRGHSQSLPVQVLMDLAFVFDQVRWVGKQLAVGGPIAATYNYEEETTISSATKQQATVASATGLAKGDVAIVDTRHATYSGFLEAVKIISVSGTTVKWDPPLDHTPADSTTFKTVVGKGSGTGLSDTGAQQVWAVDKELMRVCLGIDIYFPGARDKFVMFSPECEVLPGGYNFSGAMATAAMTFRPIQQPEETFTYFDGTTESLPWYFKGLWVPEQG